MAWESRVLVTEDEALIAMEIEGTLRLAGYRVVGPVAEAAMAARLAAEEPLDAAVLDVGLHGGSVAAAADVLAARGIPFIFLTGYSPAGLTSGSTHLGCKPPGSPR